MSQIPIGTIIKCAYTYLLILSFHSGGFALSMSSSTTSASGGTATATCSSNSYLGLDIAKLRRDIAAGRVHQLLDFLSEGEVSALLEQAGKLREGGAFAASGLSNTNRGKDQNFGEADRTVCPLPWWKDSIIGNHEAAGDVNGGQSMEGDEGGSESAAAQSRIVVSQKLQDLRALLSKELNRPTMANSDAETMAHECYFSRSTEGSTLARHMDERHEETKGSRGWLLPSRRSVSWLIYLSEPDWDLARNGGALRSFPQRAVKTNLAEVEVGSHSGNLQVGWLVVEKEGLSESIPVFLDSWHKVVTESGETEPHCILYVVSDQTNELEYITQPWLSERLQGMSISDFLKIIAETESRLYSQTNLFVDENLARDFRLLEDRTLWEAGEKPSGSEVVDIPPLRGSLVMFDSVSTPHEVGLVKEGTRTALAGWFHEATQTFPDGFYDEN